MYAWKYQARASRISVFGRLALAIWTKLGTTKLRKKCPQTNSPKNLAKLFAAALLMRTQNMMLFQDLSSPILKTGMIGRVNQRLLFHHTEWNLQALPRPYINCRLSSLTSYIVWYMKVWSPYRMCETGRQRLGTWFSLLLWWFWKSRRTAISYPQSICTTLKEKAPNCGNEIHDLWSEALVDTEVSLKNITCSITKTTFSNSCFLYLVWKIQHCIIGGKSS